MRSVIKDNPIKAVLFDLDDTLFDHRGSMLAGLTAVQNKYECFRGSPINEFELKHKDIMNDVHLNRILSGELTLDEGRALRFKKLFGHFGVEVDDTLAYESAALYRENYLTLNSLAGGALELLTELKQKYKVGIITNNLVDEQNRKLKECGIEHLVDCMITSEETGVTKPHPEIFNALLKRLNVSASEAVMIGDYWKHDILGAHALGIRSIWINVYKETHPDPSIAAEISSLNDTKHIIKLIETY